MAVPAFTCSASGSSWPHDRKRTTHSAEESGTGGRHHRNPHSKPAVRPTRRPGYSHSDAIAENEVIKRLLAPPSPPTAAPAGPPAPPVATPPTPRARASPPSQPRDKGRATPRGGQSTQR